MKLGRNFRTIIIQAILALGASGSIASAIAIPASATVAAPSSHVHAVAVSAVPHTWYHM
jgi:hypothetical protein